MRNGKKSERNGCLSWFGIFLLFALAVISYISYDSPSVKVHYRIDLTLQIDEQPVSGSVVQEFVMNVSALKVPHSSNIGYGVHGEAMAIALPNKSTLFLLMELPLKDGTWSEHNRFRYRNFFRNIVKVPREDDDSSSDYVRKYRALSGTYDVPFELMPLMVRFAKESDPNSAIRIIPRPADTDIQSLKENEVLVLDAKLTITKQPVSNQISDGYPWLLESWKRPYLIPQDKLNTFAWTIGKLSFKEAPRDFFVN